MESLVQQFDQNYYFSIHKKKYFNVLRINKLESKQHSAGIITL